MKGSYDELEISLYGDSDCLFAKGSLVPSSLKKKILVKVTNTFRNTYNPGKLKTCSKTGS